MSKSIQLKNNDNEKYYPHPYYPVGSIYLSVNNTNPTIWFGGTWEQIAKGRTLVGVDTSDTDFNIVKKTGGEKKHTLTIDEMPSHKHNMGVHLGNDGGGVNSVQGSDGKYNWAGTTPLCDFPEATGGSQSHNNLQPYFTCYIWCRTA